MWYGMHLQSLRERSGLTRAEVSSRTGISRSTLAKIEAGVNVPTIEQFIRLANSLRLRLPKLLMDVGVIRVRDMAVALKEAPAQNAAHLQPKMAHGRGGSDRVRLRRREQAEPRTLSL